MMNLIKARASVGFVPNNPCRILYSSNSSLMMRRLIRASNTKEMIDELVCGIFQLRAKNIPVQIKRGSWRVLLLLLKW